MKKPRHRVPTAAGSSVSKACSIQLARLFGSQSTEAQAQTRTPRQWKHTLRLVLRELDRYVTANTDSDSLHQFRLASALYAADQSLDEDDFWPGYVEGITRLALVLMGDYPDHRRRKGGAKAADHYSLDGCRSLRYIQNDSQRLATLLTAGQSGPVEFSVPPRQALATFRQECGFRATYKSFFEWYRQRYPQDYAALF